MNTSLNTLDFNGTALDVIAHEGQRWLTAEQVGTCLGYAEANAGQSIINVYNRNADEFTESDTCQIKLISQGQSRTVRLFSSTGCNKLGFFANTPCAKEFRTWASRVLAGQAVVMEPTPGRAALTGDKVDKLLDLMEQILRVIPKLLEATQNGNRQKRSRRCMHQEDVARILSLRERGYTLDELVTETDFSQSQCWCVITGRYKVLESGRVSIDSRSDAARAADAAAKAERASAAVPAEPAAV